MQGLIWGKDQNQVQLSKFTLHTIKSIGKNIVDLRLEWIKHDWNSIPLDVNSIDCKLKP